MKKFILSLFVVTLFGCSKKDVIVPIPIVVTPPVVIKPTPNIPIGFYVGKTSYELKTPYGKIINIDSIRKIFGVLNKGIHNGTNNLGYCYIDINNDGLEDIFYPYSSDGIYNIRPDIFVNKGDKYVLDNSYLPENYSGNQVTRKTIVGDYNNDSLPDLFLCNSGWEDFNAKIFALEENTLLLSNKHTGTYEIGKLPNIGKSFWHGAASGDVNGDKNIDIIVTEGTNVQLLINDGKGNFSNLKFSKIGDGFITTEILDVDKDGLNDIIMAGEEGKDGMGIQTKPTIFFNKGNLLFTPIIIAEVNSNGWGLVMDIVCFDIDNDGLNEIILDRTGDRTKVFYGGYNVTIHKTFDNYKSFEDKSELFISGNIFYKTTIGGWITKMFLKKENDNVILNCDVSAADNTNWKPSNKKWIQNKQTFKFE